MVNLESVCDKVEKDNELGIWDENQDYVKILYFSSSRILVKKMGKRWSHRISTNKASLPVRTMSYEG